jgi:hypothetical protein
MSRSGRCIVTRRSGTRTWCVMILSSLLGRCEVFNHKLWREQLVSVCLPEPRAVEYGAL